MFVIDYLTHSEADTVSVSPFHTGHLGLIPGTKVTATLLHSSSPNKPGSEICITPYNQQLDTLCRLKCVLKDQAGVVHRLLRAIAAMRINILSLESATLESKRGHGVYLLLDWSTTNTPRPIDIPANLENLFFPQLSGIIPANDLRYLDLLRQLMGQCADIIDWTDPDPKGHAFPRLAINEFDETRILASSGPVDVSRPTRRKRKPVKLSDVGVRITLDPRVAAGVRVATGRDEAGQALHYILLSDIESKTLRIFVPQAGRERRMLHLGFSHKNKPGALFAITKLIADSGLSIFASLVRKLTTERNIFEVTVEHESKELSEDTLYKRPEEWLEEFFPAMHRPQHRALLRYFSVSLQSPMYPPTRRPLEWVLYQGTDPVADDLSIVGSEEAEADIEDMKNRMRSKPEYQPRRWLTDMLFADEWGPKGKPSVFLSFPRGAEAQVRALKAALGTRFHYRQHTGGGGITLGAIDSIARSHYFIGIWHHEKKHQSRGSPWMPFEYGVAMTCRKPSVVLCHKNLEDAYAGRINRDEPMIIYGDLTKQSEILQILKSRCELWGTSHRRLTI